MHRADIWRRLLWKEFREGWLVVLILMGLPVAVFNLKVPTHGGETLASWAVTLCTMGAPLLAVLWGARGASSASQRKDLVSANLPVMQWQRLLISFVLPCVVLLVVGAWFGVWAGVAAPDRKHYWVVWMAYFPASYALGYFLSSAASVWLAAVVGLVWSFQGFALVAAAAMGSEVGWASLRYGVAATICLLVQVLGSRKLSPLASRSVALGLFFVFFGCIYGWLVGEVWPSRHSQKDAAFVPEWHGGRADQRGLGVAVEDGHSATLIFRDHLNCTGQNEHSRMFDHHIRILGVRQRRYVYLVQQLPREKSLRVLVWDALAKPMTVKTVASVPAGRDALSWVNRFHSSLGYWSDPGERGMNGDISPSGRYALLVTESRIGTGKDVWLIDVQRNRGGIVSANSQPSLEQLVWLRDKAIMAGSRDGIAIDLRRMTARRWDPRQANRE